MLLLLQPITFVSESVHKVILGTPSATLLYHIFMPVELCFITLYFFEVMKPKHIWRWRITFCSAYALAAILNEVFLQSYKRLNSNFCAFESFVVIVLGLYAFYHFLLHDDNQKITANVDFKIWAVLFFYFSATFSFWSFVRYLYNYHLEVYHIALVVHLVVNNIMYLSISLFLFTPYRPTLPWQRTHS